MASRIHLFCKEFDVAMGQRSVLQNRLADLYFRPKWFEGSGKLFVLLGIEFFKGWMVKWGRLRKKQPTAEQDFFIWDRSPQGLRKFEAKTRRNELIHLAFTVIGIPVILGAFVRGWPLAGTVLLILVAGTQIYPVMLQRYHRVRLYRVVARRTRREGAKNRRAGDTSKSQ